MIEGDPSQYPVCNLNETAMKAILAEGAQLRRQKESEKDSLLREIDVLIEHCGLVRELYQTGRIGPDLKDISDNVVTFLEGFVKDLKEGRQPQHRTVNVSKELPIDQVERAKQLYEDVNEIEMRLRELSELQTSLVLEESKISAQHSNCFEEANRLRQECHDLIQQKEAADAEVEELKEELDFWKEANDRTNKMLSESIKELQSLQVSKDAQTIKLMEDLAKIYTTLDGESKRLRAIPS